MTQFFTASQGLALVTAFGLAALSLGFLAIAGIGVGLRNLRTALRR